MATFASPQDFIPNGISFIFTQDLVMTDDVIAPDLIVVPHAGFYRDSVSITVDGTVLAKVQYTLDNPPSATAIWKDWPDGSADATDPTKLTLEGGLQAPVGGLRVAGTGSGHIHFVVRETTFR